MPDDIRTDQARSFKQILARNIALPIAIGFGSATVFVAIILYLLSVINWVEHTDRVVADTTELARLAVEQESNMRGFLIAGDEVFVGNYNALKSRMESQLAGLKDRIADNPAQVARLQNIESMQAQWNRFAESVIDMRRQGRDYREAVLPGQGRRMTDEVRREFTAILDEERRLRKLRNDEAQETARWVLVGYVAFTVIISLILAIFGRRQLMTLSGNYSRALDEQIRHGETMQKQAWLRAGQSRLAERIIGHSSLQQMGAGALDHLADYLGFVVGAIYVHDAEGRLSRFAVHGMEGSSADSAFHAAGGLVAQTAQGQRVVALEDLPAGYLRVSSGTGEGASQSALIVPLTADGEVNGVLEMGFLRKLEKRDLELMELIGGTLGTAISTSLYRQRLQESLTHTQQLNEELQVQQEELRTANEELEEQSHVLKESQAQLESQQAELEQTNERLSEQALMLDQRNQDLRIAQDDLRQHADELQRASRYKSEFLANMSHELRTPLNSSLILARLLAENAAGNLTDEQVRFAQSITSAGNDLLNLINDILDISKVEAGHMELVIEPVLVTRLADSLRQTFEPLAMQKQLAFSVDVAEETPQMLRTDRQRVEQVLKNLLSNAIKFTESGSVSMKVSPGGHGGIDFTVQDTGIGIAESQHEVIFEAFRQADGTTSRRYGGTGLGLSISRNLAQLLGGSISVESEAGKGSRFVLHLPLVHVAQEEPARVPPVAANKAASPPPPRKPAPAHDAPAPGDADPAFVPPPPFDDDRSMPSSGRSVLVIEDEPQFAHILYDLAHERDYRCFVAQGAQEGVAMASEFLPDAILLDMRLPDKPGLDVLQQLKDNPRTRHIPVHVISASDAREAALHMGAIGYAMKPATRDQLLKVFHQLEDRLTRRLKRVLLVEDDARQRDSVVQLIGDDDVDIMAVATGTEALAQLHGQIFDCMIIDLKLPDMDGAQLLERMSTEDIQSFPPVIVYTGRNLTREEERQLLRYSRSIIIKGARSPERLLDEVTLFLHKVESNLSQDRQNMLRSARSRDKVFEQRRILLVDDDVRNVFALTSALEQKGLTVVAARNGLEALQKLDTLPDIDLVLMDIMMPEMDGLEATRRIRADSRFSALPVIAITAKAMKDDQEECLKAGANDYLAKPVDLDRLFSMLRVWMPRLERF
jgi:CheY-like chemotaxis protein/signal transduction histidine kinase/CHASE3 domain sensor protein